jgi:hypothetical protein
MLLLFKSDDRLFSNACSFGKLALTHAQQPTRCRDLFSDEVHF